MESRNYFLNIELDCKHIRINTISQIFHYY